MRRNSWFAVLPLLALALPACNRATGRPDQPPPQNASRVPDIKGMPMDQARATLASQGFQVGQVLNEETDTFGYPAGTVVAQRPRVGTLAEPGSTVDLKIAAGGALATRSPESAPYAPPPSAPSDPWAPTDPSVPAYTPSVVVPQQPGTIPDLGGFTTQDAREYASRAGYEIIESRVPGHPAGRVVSQDPGAGVAAAAGTRIVVQVTAGGDMPGFTPPSVTSSGILDVLVPNVLDRTGSGAHRILEGMGLTVRQEATASGVPGRVMDQVPMAGERVAKGSEVLIRVANAEAAAASAGVPSAAPPPAIPPSYGPPISEIPPVPTAPPDPTFPTMPTPPAPPTVDVTPAPSLPPEPTAPYQPPPPPPYVPPGPSTPPSGPTSAASRALTIPPDPAPPVNPTYSVGPTTSPTPTYVPPPLTPYVPPVEPVAPAAPPPPPPPSEAPPPIPPYVAPETPPYIPPAPPPPPPPVAPENPMSPSAPSTLGFVPPEPVSPQAEAFYAADPRFALGFTWTAVSGAEGYMIELQQWSGSAWVELQRKVALVPSLTLDIEPTVRGQTDLRWRVRTVIGKKGSRPSAWRTIHLR